MLIYRRKLSSLCLPNSVDIKETLRERLAKWMLPSEMQLLPRHFDSIEKEFRKRYKECKIGMEQKYRPSDVYTALDKGRQVPFPVAIVLTIQGVRKCQSQKLQ